MSNRVGTDRNLEAGGNYDLLLIKIEGIYPEGKVTFGLYDVPKKISGLQKAAQHFLRTLLTSKGSDPFYPNKGTFMPALMVGSNILADRATFISDITSAVSDASSQARSMLNINVTDLSSTIDSVEVLGVDVVSEGYFVALSLKTLAGDNARISLPFPEVDGL